LKSTNGGPTRLLSVALGGSRFVVLSAPGHSEKRAFGALSQAERAVAELATQGLSDETIAKLRGVSKRTVANQLSSVFKKVGVGSRFELAARFV
jgi:DNA-binding NarL/FixJ family response regulator